MGLLLIDIDFEDFVLNSLNKLINLELLKIDKVDNNKFYIVTNITENYFIKIKIYLLMGISYKKF